MSENEAAIWGIHGGATGKEQRAKGKGVRAKSEEQKAQRQDFLKYLEQAPDVEPPENDRLPEGYQPKAT